MNMYTEIRSTKQGFTREGEGGQSHTHMYCFCFIPPSLTQYSFFRHETLYNYYGKTMPPVLHVLALVLDEIRGLYEGDVLRLVYGCPL